MLRHGASVVEITHRNFDHVVTVVPEPSADVTIPGCRCRIAVDVLAQTVEVDADAFVIVVVGATVDHVWCGRADCSIENNLLAPHAFGETGIQ